jgi:hypothetical protein
MRSVCHHHTRLYWGSLCAGMMTDNMKIFSARVEVEGTGKTTKLECAEKRRDDGEGGRDRIARG